MLPEQGEQVRQVHFTLMLRLKSLKVLRKPQGSRTMLPKKGEHIGEVHFFHLKKNIPPLINN